MTLKNRHAVFHALIELMHPDHAKTCTINACRCPQDVFDSAVRLTRYTHEERA